MIVFFLMAFYITNYPVNLVQAEGIRNPSFTSSNQTIIGFAQKSMKAPVSGVEYVKFNANGKKVIFRVEAPTLASVDKTGKVIGRKQGNTTLYAKCGGKEYQSRLTIYTPRLSSETATKTVPYEDYIVVTLKDKKASETIRCEVANPSVVKAEVTSWNKDKATIRLTPVKDGITTLKIRRSKSVEELEIKINVKLLKELSAVELYQRCSKAMVEIQIKTVDGEDGLGSGFFIDGNKIVTNYHVIKGAESIKVMDYNDKEYVVEYLYDYDEKFDLAVLGVKAQHEAIPISYQSSNTGDRIYTIGSPYGLTGTFSTGIVSKAIRLLDDDIYYTQITASISRGNSGGPLINRFGEVIGVNTLTRGDGQNLNFAVPITYLLDLNQSTPTLIKDFFEMNIVGNEKIE